MSKALKEGLEGEEQRLHRIRITLTSKDLKSIERGEQQRKNDISAFLEVLKPFCSRYMALQTRNRHMRLSKTLKPISQWPSLYKLWRHCNI